MKKSIIILSVAGLLAGCAATDTAPVQKTINQEEVISKMTLEDKAHFVIGTGMAGFSGDDAVIGATRSLVPGAAGTTYPLDSLGIPAVVLADGPAGLRIDPTREGDSATDYCTHFPIGTLLASTWNTQLVEEVGEAIGEEVKEYGADVLLAPALNIMRNPLCGRTSSTILRIPWWPVRPLVPTSLVSRRTMSARASSTLPPTTRRRTA